MRSHGLALLVALALALVACSGQAVTNDQAAAESDTESASAALEESELDTSAQVEDEALEPAFDSAALEAELQSVMDAWEINADGGGVAYVRTADGTDAVVASGLDPQSNAALETDARVRLGSISKPIVATMVMQLVDEGLVDLDEPVSVYLPDLELPGDPTVRNVLAHETGIGNYTETRVFAQITFSNPENEPTPEDLISYVEPEPLFPAGSTFAYSNTNYIVAGRLIEEVTDMSLADAFETQITGPLGLTSMEFADGTLSDVAGGYSLITPSGNTFDQPYTSVATGAWAAGALVGSVEDLAGFFDALLFGDLVTEDARREMLGDIAEGGPYGLGLHGGDDFGVGHGGLIVGFNSMAQIDLDTREVVIVSVNNDGRRTSILTRQLTDILRG